MRGNSGAAYARRGEEALRRYVTESPASQDAGYAAAGRRAAILLRAAAALAAAERAAARAAALMDDPGRRPADGPDVTDEGIRLLTQALAVAGLTASGDRARCLYGLGGILLIRFARAGAPADLARSIVCPEDARAGVESARGEL